MQVTVSYRRQDSGHGGRLEADLRRRLRTRDVVRGPGAGRADALVVVIGPSWPGDGVHAEVGSMLEAGVPAVPVLVGEAAMPPGKALPARSERLPSPSRSMPALPFVVEFTLAPNGDDTSSTPLASADSTRVECRTVEG